MIKKKKFPQIDLKWKNFEIFGPFNSSNLQVTISKGQYLS